MKRLRELRNRIGLTQVQLAAMLGVTQSVVADWEAGRTMPGGAKLPNIADALGCTIDALYGREPPGGQDQERPAS